MKTSTIKTNAMPNAPVGKAWDEVSASFDRFCLAAGIETLDAMMEADAEAASGPRARRKGIAAAKLGAGGRGGLARPVGDEPDADQRVNAQVSACGPIAG